MRTLIRDVRVIDRKRTRLFTDVLIENDRIAEHNYRGAGFVIDGRGRTLLPNQFRRRQLAARLDDVADLRNCGRGRQYARDQGARRTAGAERWQERCLSCGRYTARGVQVVAGTDANPVAPAHGECMHQELLLLVAAGLAAEEALTAATSARPTGSGCSIVPRRARGCAPTGC